MGGWGSAPDPAGGGYSAPQTPIASGEVGSLPFPNNSIPLRPFGPQSTALRALPTPPQLLAYFHLSSDHATGKYSRRQRRAQWPSF